MFRKKNAFLNKHLEFAKSRLKTTVTWFPYPCLFSFGIALLFSGHILLGINPRIGNPANVLPFRSELAQEGSIWISVSMQKGKIFVSTDTRHVFTWDENIQDLNAIEPFVKDLERRLVQITLSASLAKEISHTESIVILAVDQNLKYLHIRPILAALAKAGISDYAFETRRPAT